MVFLWSDARVIPTLCYSQGSTGDCDKSSFWVMGGAVAFGENIVTDDATDRSIGRRLSFQDGELCLGRARSGDSDGGP